MTHYPRIPVAEFFLTHPDATWTGPGSTGWICTHGAPIREDLWLRYGLIVDVDGREHDPGNGQPIRSPR